MSSGAIGSDVRAALRSLRRTPRFTLLVLLLLAVSTGGLLSVYSGVQSVLVRPLQGVRDGETLVWLGHASRRLVRPQGLSYPDLVDYREQGAPVLAGLAGYDAVPLSLSSGGEPVRLTGHVVAGPYFEVLGVGPLLGRFFTPAEAVPGGRAAAVVLGETLWRGRFGSDSSLIGRSIRLNGEWATVIGVAPPGFAGPDLGAPADLWVPAGDAVVVAPDLAASVERRDRLTLRVIGRLRPGVTRRSAEAALAAVGARLSGTYPGSHEWLAPRLYPLRGGATPDTRGELLPIAGLVTAVAIMLLVIACLNIANLLLARAVRRGAEIGVRLALGARRSQVVRLLLVESLLLAAGGGLGGLLLSRGLAGMVGSAEQGIRSLDLTPGPALAAAVTAVILAAALLAGLAPALHVTRPDLAVVLKEGAWGASTGRRGLRLQRALLVSQLTLSVVLLFSAGLFVTRVDRLTRSPLGFEPGGVTLLSYDLSLQQYDAARRLGFHRAVVAQVSALPDVGAAAQGNVVPLSGVLVGSEVWVDPTAPGEATPVWTNGVSPGYFATLRIPVREGREFTDQDGPGAPPVGIVNQAASRRLFPDRPALGAVVRLGAGAATEPVVIVGIVADARLDEADEAPAPVLYLPLAQRPVLARTTLFVRGRRDGPPPARPITDVIQRLDPSLPVFEVSSFPDVVRDRLDRRRAIGRLLGGFGVVGTLIAAIGLSGIIGYLVTQRTREIGVRLALGAGPRRVTAMILGDGLRVALVGIGLGGLLAIPVAWMLSGGSLGLGLATGGLTFALVAAGLVGVVVVASFLPARRAGRIPPASALRSE